MPPPSSSVRISRFPASNDTVSLSRPNFAPEVRREKRKLSSRNLANFTTPTFMLASPFSPKNQGNPETRGNLIKFDKMSGARASRMDGSRRAQSARKAWITIPCKTSRLTCRWREKDTRRWHTGARFYFPGVTINFSPSFFSFSRSSHVARAVLWPVLLRYTIVSIAKPLRHAYKYIYLYKYRAPGTARDTMRGRVSARACVCVCVLAHVVTHKGD